MKTIILFTLLGIVSLSCGLSSPKSAAEKLGAEWFAKNFVTCGEGVFTRYEGKKLVIDPSINRKLMTSYSYSVYSSSDIEKLRTDGTVARSIIEIRNPAYTIEEEPISEAGKLSEDEFDGYAVITPSSFSYRYFDLDNIGKGWSQWRLGPIVVAPDFSDSVMQLGARYAGVAELQAKTPFRVSVSKVKGHDWRVSDSKGLSRPDCSQIPQ